MDETNVIMIKYFPAWTLFASGDKGTKPGFAFCFDTV